MALLVTLALAPSASARSTHARATTQSIGSDGQTCDDSFAARRDYAASLAGQRPSASGESYFRELYRLMLICKADQAAVDDIWITGTKPAGTPLPDHGHVTAGESVTNEKRRARNGRQARTLSCSVTIANPFFYTNGAGIRVVYASGVIGCNEQAPLRGWVDLWRRYNSTGTVVIPYNDIFASSPSNINLLDATPDSACAATSSYKTADLLMQRFNGSSWGGNTVLETLWHAGNNYGCP